MLCYSIYLEYEQRVPSHLKSFLRHGGPESAVGIFPFPWLDPHSRPTQYVYHMPMRRDWGLRHLLRLCMEMYLCVYQPWASWSYMGILRGSSLVPRKPPVSPWIRGLQIKDRLIGLRSEAVCYFGRVSSCSQQGSLFLWFFSFRVILAFLGLPEFQVTKAHQEKW